MLVPARSSLTPSLGAPNDYVGRGKTTVRVCGANAESHQRVLALESNCRETGIRFEFNLPSNIRIDFFSVVLEHAMRYSFDNHLMQAYDQSRRREQFRRQAKGGNLVMYNLPAREGKAV